MFRLIGRILFVAIVVIGLLFVFQPNFAANAGNTLLSAANNSTVKGAVQILADSQGKNTNLQLDLQGLLSKLHYVVTLDQDSCGGKVITNINFAKNSVDQDGKAKFTLQLPEMKDLQKPVWVDIRENSATGKSVACGQITLNSVTTTATPTAIPVIITPAASNPNSQDQSQIQWIWGVLNFPQTGVEQPAGHDSYSNYKFPRKY